MSIKNPSGIVLKRAHGITVQIDSANAVTISVGSRSRCFSNEALTLLNIFAQPFSLQEGLNKFKIAERQDWIRLTSTVRTLHEIGALINSSGNLFVPDSNPLSFGSPAIHVTMLNDRARTESFIRGIRTVVKKGDVVVDIGTGSGILAIAAARAGAGKVYAIETSAIADVAQANFDQTEVASKITLIRGWSNQVDLPEKADVLVSEIIGNDPFAENVINVFRDARQRLLKPGARMVPGRIKVYGLLVEIPLAELKNRVVQSDDLENWQSWYGVDFSALKTKSADGIRPVLWMNAEKSKSLTIRGKSILLADVDFRESNTKQPETYTNVSSEDPFNGLLLYFELELGNILMTNHPLAEGRAVHWPNPVWFLREADAIGAGEKFTIHYNCPGRKSEIRLIPQTTFL